VTKDSKKSEQKTEILLFVETNGVVSSEVFMSALCEGNSAQQHNVLFFPETFLCLCRNVTKIEQSACIHHIYPTQTLLYTFCGLLTLSSQRIKYSTSVEKVQNCHCILLYNINKCRYCTMPIEHRKQLPEMTSDVVGMMHNDIDTAYFKCVSHTYNGMSLPTVDWEFI